MLENRDKLNLNLPILLVLVLFFSSQAFVKLLLILLEIKQIYIYSVYFVFYFAKLTFSPQNVTGLGELDAGLDAKI